MQGPWGRVAWVENGQVITDPHMDGYIGAPGPTNNTGELTAMYVALTRACSRAPGSGREEIHTDSLYALNMTTGKWMPRREGNGMRHRNADMIARLRRLWRQLLRLRPREVTLRHVRSHTSVPGNELADWLADRGAANAKTRVQRAAQWMHDWLRRMDPHRIGRERAHGTEPGPGGRDAAPPRPPSDG